MISIDLEKRLNKKNKDINSFLNDYTNCIFLKEWEISTSKNVNKFEIPTVYLNKKSMNIVELFDIYCESFENFRKYISYISLLIFEKEFESSEFFVRNIIQIDVDNLKNLKILFDELLLSDKEKFKKEKERLKKLFMYNEYRKEFIKYFYNLNFHVCIYCNRNYISNLYKEDDSEHTVTFTLDHFYDKATYPIISLSFYNLIPSCYVCNTIVKNQSDTIDFLNPYSKDYNLHKRTKFSINSKFQPILRPIDASDSITKKYIKDFRINEIYASHVPEIKDFYLKRNVFTDELIKLHAGILKRNELTVKKAVFGSEVFDDVYDKVPLTKLKKDLAEKFNLL